MRVRDFLYTVSAEELFQPQENGKGTQNNKNCGCKVIAEYGMTEAFLD